MPVKVLVEFDPRDPGDIASLKALLGAFPAAPAPTAASSPMLDRTQQSTRRPMLFDRVGSYVAPTGLAVLDLVGAAVVAAPRNASPST